MGLFGNIFKPLQGKLTAKQEENMKKVAEVFKEKTGKVPGLRFNHIVQHHAIHS